METTRGNNTMVKIINRYTRELIIETPGADLVRAYLVGANLRGADLGEANLRGAYLGEADLRGAYLLGADLLGANLGEADLRGAHLVGANLGEANLGEADLGEANLWEANLVGANLRGADLWKANLRGANLVGANLWEANLRGANLRGANLRGANLRGAIDVSPIIAAQLFVPPQKGPFSAFKKLRDGKIVELLIPADAKRSSATTRKCRAEYAVVISGSGFSRHDQSFSYREGETVRCDEWCDDRWQECAGGIHFFMTREEAEDY